MNGLLLNSKNRRGFTLTEAAIILGISGIVLAAIWGAASMVQRKHYVNETLGVIIQITQNIRTLYQRQSAFSGVGAFSVGGDITTQMVNAEVFPQSTIVLGNPNQPMTPWKTEIDIIVGGPIPPSAAPNSFIVSLNGASGVLTREDCIALASRTVGPGRDEGLYEITIDGNTFTGAAALNALSPADIANLPTCSTLGLRFNLKG